MKKITSFLLVVTLTILCGMTAFAAPKTMPDGNKFDPQFYATEYPAVNDLAKGDENLLYAHYLNFGKLMGYIPYEGYTDNTAAVVTRPTATVNAVPQQITGNGTPAVSVQISSKSDYILNTSTKKFHYLSCSSVDSMKEKNKEYYSGDRDTVINRGFDPCKKCNP